MIGRTPGKPRTHLVRGQGLAFDDFTISYSNGNATVYVTPPLGMRPTGMIIIENVAIGSIGANDFLF